MNEFCRVKKPPVLCPNCGAGVPKNARSCPECGADEQTGWSEEAQVSGLGLPDEDFDYEEFVKREFEPQKSRIPQGVKPLWWTVALILVVVLLAFWLRGFLGK